MRSQSWFGKLWKRLSASVVQDVPPRLEACELCREVECNQERWLSCERRLATEAARMRVGPVPSGAAAVAPTQAPAPAVEPNPAHKPKPASS